jgi:probable phosphoglycerate mutase
MATSSTFASTYERTAPVRSDRRGLGYRTQTVSRSDDETSRPARGAQATREARGRAEPLARIVLLRHAEPDWAPGGGTSVNDPGLTPFGVAQSRCSAERLAQESIDAIYVSPYRRSQETAAALSAATGLKPVTVSGLAEIGVAVEGLDQAEVDRYFVEGSQRPLNEHWEGWPGAESFHDFHARVSEGMAEVLARHEIRPIHEHDFTVWLMPERAVTIVVVAHGGTNAVALTHLLDVRPVPWEWLRFESELAAFSVVHARSVGARGHVWSLQNFNEIDHLREARLR